MTRFSRPALLGGVLLSCGIARAQQAPTAPPDARPANVLNVTVAPLAPAPTGAALLELAKAANINLLADLDDAAPASVATLDKTLTLHAALNRLSGENGWSWRRLDERTFGLWKQPDLIALARAVVADANANAPATQTPAMPGAAQLPGAGAELEPLNVALTRFFAAPAARN